MSSYCTVYKFTCYLDELAILAIFAVLLVVSNSCLYLCLKVREKPSSRRYVQKQEEGTTKMDDAEQAQPQPQQLLLSPDEENIIKLLRLRRQSKLLEPICEAVDEAVEEFLENIRGEVRELLFYDPDAAIRPRGEEVTRGLDCDLDTEEQVEATIRCFPSVLSEKKRGAYPIHWQVDVPTSVRYNLKAFSFIPLFAKLGIELGQFPEEERGGLLAANSHGYNALQYITCTFDSDRSKRENKDHHHPIDEKCSLIMKRLKKENLLSKEDIREHNLVGLLSTKMYSFFPEQRFRFLSDWDPTTLIIPCRPDIGIYLPIMFTANAICFRGFQVVLEAGMRHYPMKLGFVFLKGQTVDGEDTETSYQLACKEYGTETATKEILDRISEYFPATGSAKSNLLSFAAEEAIDLDGLYLFLRREPSVLSRLP